MSANTGRPPSAAVVGRAVFVELEAAAVWAPVLAKAIREAEKRGENVKPLVRDVARAFHDAAVFVNESNMAKAEPDHAEWSRSLVTAAQVADLAGVTAQAVRLAARQGRLPGCRPGREWQFERKDVQEWIEDRGR